MHMRAALTGVAWYPEGYRPNPPPPLLHAPAAPVAPAHVSDLCSSHVLYRLPYAECASSTRRGRLCSTRLPEVRIVRSERNRGVGPRRIARGGSPATIPHESYSAPDAASE